MSEDLPDTERRADAAPALPTVAVAYSGGRDSTALLHATLAEAHRHGVRVVALHVHHGLSANADAWLAHCEGECRRWRAEGRAVDFVAFRLHGKAGAGQSIEAWARAGRYAALRTMALTNGASLVLLAHHRQDQAETWLLQALRGGGVAGLSAMPESAERDDIHWARPWLHRPRSDLQAYVERHRLSCIEDDGNQDLRFARNRLRLQVWPALTAAFVDAEAVFARAATWAQQANAALAELAEIDVATATATADGEAGLVVERWLGLSVARRSNALRFWLSRRAGAVVSASLTMRLMAELPRARNGRWSTPGGELRLYRGVLDWAAAGETVRQEQKTSMKEAVLSIRREGTYPLPGWGGRLEVRGVDEGGVPLAWLGHLELRDRGGGERFQAGAGRPLRSLKKQFQSAGIAGWHRDGPLVYSGGQLVFVPGLGLDARMVGMPGQPAVGLRWVTAASLAPTRGRR